MLTTPTRLNKPPLSGVMERLWREVMGEGEEREEVPLGKRQEVMAVSGTK